MSYFLMYLKSGPDGSRYIRHNDKEISFQSCCFPGQLLSTKHPTPCAPTALEARSQYIPGPSSSYPWNPRTWEMARTKNRYDCTLLPMFQVTNGSTPGSQTHLYHPTKDKDKVQKPTPSSPHGWCWSLYFSARHGRLEGPPKRYPRKVTWTSTPKLGPVTLVISLSFGRPPTLFFK